MKRVDAGGCRRHVLVCVNEREGTSMPCCASAGAEAVYERLRRWIAEQGMLGQIWLSRAGCLGWCHVDGATVVVYPEGAWYRAVTVADCEDIIAGHLQPVVDERPDS